MKRQQGLPGTGAVINGVQSQPHRQPHDEPSAGCADLHHTDPSTVLRRRLGKFGESEGDWEAFSTRFSPRVFLQERAFVKLEHKYT